MYVIPDKINAFNVYQDGVKHIGISDEVTLPEVKELTSEMSGPGILGNIDSPAHGLFDSMEIEVPFRTLFFNAFNMMRALNSIDITLRGSIQTQDGMGDLIGIAAPQAIEKEHFKNLNIAEAVHTVPQILLTQAGAMPFMQVFRFLYFFHGDTSFCEEWGERYGRERQAPPLRMGTLFGVRFTGRSIPRYPDRLVFQPRWGG